MSHPALSDLDFEINATRRLLECIPDDKLEWKPHEKSWTLGELATHIANLFAWQKGILQMDEFNLNSIGAPDAGLNSKDEIIVRFDSYVEELNKRLNTMEVSDFEKVWTLKNGERVVNKQLKLAAFRTTCISHLIHHRGQLTVYLRLLDIPLPPTYGPTADEQVSW